jgi:hypothetical protein
MPLEDGMKPEEDIQQALHQAHSIDEPHADSGTTHNSAPMADTLAHQASCPLRHGRYALYKCGLIAEKYPCQTTAALLITAGCGWLCSYFGLTVLAALLLYAINAEE